MTGNEARVEKSPEDLRRFNRAEQVRSLGPRRSPGAISGWRFPRDLAGNLCAVCDDRCADTARRIEILERRPAGGVCDPERSAAAALSRRTEIDQALNRFSRALNRHPDTNLRNCAGSSNASVTANGTIPHAHDGSPSP